MKFQQTAPFQYRLEGSVGSELAAEVQNEVSIVLRREDAAPNQTHVFDLSGVVDGNSVTIALMMGWLREATRQERQISFQGVPESLVELIEFYGLDGVLPLLADPLPVHSGTEHNDEPEAQDNAD